MTNIQKFLLKKYRKELHKKLFYFQNSLVSATTFRRQNTKINNLPENSFFVLFTVNKLILFKDRIKENPIEYHVSHPIYKSLANIIYNPEKNRGINITQNLAQLLTAPNVLTRSISKFLIDNFAVPFKENQIKEILNNYKDFLAQLS